MTPEPKRLIKQISNFYQKLGTEFKKDGQEIKLYDAAIIFTDNDVSEDRNSCKKILVKEKEQFSSIINKITKSYYGEEDWYE